MLLKTPAPVALPDAALGAPPALAAASVADEPDCSGHGKLADGKCVCDNPWPEPGGSGWTGPECRIAVFAPPADTAGTPGAELTQPCKEQGCDSLQPGTWHCHAVRTPFK